MADDTLLWPLGMLLSLQIIWTMSSTVECQVCSTAALEEFGGYQYVFYHGDDGVTRSFAEARSYCQTLGGDLPVITSEEQNEFIAGKLLRDGHYWIGLEDMDNDEFYRWIDGTKPGYQPWDPNLYSNQDQPHCAVIRSIVSTVDPSHGKWNQLTCTLSRQHVCQIPIDVVCRWHELGESQYLIMEEPKATVDDARATCQSHGGDLAIVKTAEINTFLKDLLPPCPTCHDYFCYWFGLQRSGVGEFTWLDGTTPGFTYWDAATEPNNVNSWGCLGLRSGPSWYDQPSHISFPFICERTRALPESKWTHLGRTLYYISQSWMTSYSFARKFCQAQGGDLAQPKTEEINAHLLGLAEGNSFWIGLDSLEREGMFQWVDGTAVGNETLTALVNIVANWVNESCVHQYVTNGWSRRPCTSYIRFACEMNIGGLEGTQGQELVITTDEMVTESLFTKGGFERTQEQESVISTDEKVTESLFTKEYPPLVTEDPMLTCGQFICLRSWILFGISMMCNVVLAGGIVLLCFQKRRATSTPPTEPSKAKTDPSPQYENPAFEGHKAASDTHTYQDLTTVRKEDYYEEL